MGGIPMVRTVAVVTATMAALVASSAQAATPVDTSCGGLAPTLGGLPAAADAARAGQREPSAWKNPPIDEAPSNGKPFSATIRVYVHVFTDGAEGRLSSSTIQQQITVLNQNFSGTGFRFTLAGVDYTNNATWFRDLDSNTSAERAAKAATHAGDANDLNLWTTNGPSYLGFATFPSWYKRSPQLDGIVLDYQSFPGGAYGTQFSLGKTATHETGHWLGLLHTFQGACNAKGDYVDDTPAEATPTSGCPEGKDTCTAPGLDPIHNYMDYSFDSCYTMFSAGQIQRMHDQFAYFRADGGTSVGN
jgi:hypothetical protein